MRKLFYIIYKIFAKRLPSSSYGFFRMIRYFFVKACIKKCGKNVNIDRGASISQDLIIGDNSGVGQNSFVEKNVEIGNNVMMGPECLIYTRNHCFSSVEKPMIEQGFSEYKKVVIQDDVWIGGRVIILPGVNIAKGAVIGAGSVVTKDVPSYAIFAGNPAHLIRYRTNAKK